MSIDYDKKYYIDDDNGENIYDIKNLDGNDGVRDFIETNFTAISLSEIIDNMDDIEKHYYEWGKEYDFYGNIKISYADEYGLTECLNNDEDYNNLEMLYDNIIHRSIVIKKWDDNYIKLFTEASEYGFCDINNIPTTVKNTVNIKKEQIIPGA